MCDSNYQIIKAQLPLVGGIGGHNFLVLKDNDGNVVDEYNGLATGSDGNIKPMGYLASDRLVFYPKSPGVPSFYDEGISQIVLFEGSEQEALAKWDAGRRAGDKINEKNYGYPILGVGPSFNDESTAWGENSNSVASTLLKAMELDEENVSKDGWTPGEGKLLLSEDEFLEVINPTSDTQENEKEGETQNSLTASVLGGAKQSKLMAISIAPSLNYTNSKRTSVGAFTLTQTLDNSASTASQTNFNGQPAYLLSQTAQPTCTGDEPGWAGGVKSGTVGKEVKPTAGSGTIIVEGKQLVREGDSCTMNNANTTGKYTKA